MLVGDDPDTWWASYHTDVAFGPIP